MKIERITGNKKRFLPLLLLADEQESMIDRYLERGDLFVMYDVPDMPVALAVVTAEGPGVCELKNLAVSPSLQRKGYGSRMLDFLCNRYCATCHTLLVGTGDSVQTTSFYRKNGFVYSHTVPDFFLRNYDHPIIEEGKQLKDMIYFSKPLSDSAAYPLRPVTLEDIPEMRDLFCSTVLSVNSKDYTPEEVADWASCGESTEHWADLLSRLYFMAALDSEGHIIGFASIRDDGYLHSMFVHKDWQGRGVATALLKEMEGYARRQGIAQITSEVSITARPFFEKRGYVVQKAQQARANQFEMTNFIMVKNLNM